MNLSEEELVRYVRIQERGMVHADRGIEKELCQIRSAIWNTPLGMKGRELRCSRYREKMADKSREEVLEMIARARLEEEI